MGDKGLAPSPLFLAASMAALVGLVILPTRGESTAALAMTTESSDGLANLAVVEESPRPETTNLVFTGGSATSGQYSDATRWEARVVDSGGDAIAGAVLTFTLMGADSTRVFTATTGDDGVGAVSPTLTEKPGAYELTVRYAGDDAHEGAADTVRFVVEKDDTDLDLDVQGRGKNRILTARLSDRDTPATRHGNHTIEFYAVDAAGTQPGEDSVFIGSAVTDDSGVATLEAPARYRGRGHIFEARFSGDDYLLESFDREPT